MPPSWHARSYWIKAKKEALSLIAGGGGGMQQLGDEVEGAALAALVASGAGEAVQTAVASTGAAVQRGLGQATESVSVREHLLQTGEYLLQDAALAEPFQVNVAILLNAYLGLAWQTGCRPGMTILKFFHTLICFVILYKLTTLDKAVRAI